MATPGMMPNMNSQMMLDNFKSMMITMAMVKGSSQGDSQNSFMNTIIIMLLVSFIDTIVLQVKKMFGILSNRVEQYITKKTTNISLINKLTSNYIKTKKASIIIKIETASKNPTSDAIIDTLTHLPHTKCILLQNGIYTINYSEEIEIAKGLYAQLVNGSTSQMTHRTIDNDSKVDNSTNEQSLVSKPSTGSVQVQDKESDENRLGYGYIDVYSYTMDMETLRSEINNIVKNYLIKMTNKLGNNIYYFSELPTTVYRDAQGRVDS